MSIFSFQGFDISFEFFPIGGVSVSEYCFKLCAFIVIY